MFKAKFTIRFLILTLVFLCSAILARGEDAEYARQLYTQGIIFEKTGDTNNAVERFEAAIKYDASFDKPYYQLGRIYFIETNFDKAEAMFKKVIDLDPHNIDAYLDLGSLYIEIKKYDLALDIFSKAAELMPGNFDAHYNLGNIYLEKGDLVNARAEFEKAYSISPDNPKLKQNLEEIKRKILPDTEKQASSTSGSNSIQKITYPPSKSLPVADNSHRSSPSRSLNARLLHYIAIFGIIILFLIFLPKILCDLEISCRAYKDYELSRGTLHLKQLRASLRALNTKISKLASDKNRLENEMNILESEREKELNYALSEYLVKSHLNEIEGVGPKLRDALINQCFNGTLDSLQYANGKVSGIGPQKQYAISSWVNTMKNKLPQLLKEDFSQKSLILEKYSKRRDDLSNRVERIKNELRSLYEIQRKASFEENRLSKISVFDFIKAYKANKGIALIVNEYLKGAFAEWETIPQWFKTMISEYGG